MGRVKSTVIEKRQQHLGRMADFPSPVMFSVFDLLNHARIAVAGLTRKF